VKVLVVGGGGREHALAWKLAQSPACDELHAAPGNPGIARVGACHPVRAEDAEGLLSLCRSLEIDLAVVGPVAPLVAGVADILRRGGIAVFGPSAAAAQIEGSKSFAKEVMQAAGVPAAAALSVARAPCVIKADGLAAGKGVFVCRNAEELEAGLRAAASLGSKLVIEELLEGEELSVLALCDGARAVALPAAQDFKRIGDGDEGPNTGGMGSFAPVPDAGPGEVEAILDLVHRPVLAELAGRGTPFIGTLFAGLMRAGDGIRVLEFNCRFGDPETQSILPLLDGDLLGALAGAAAGSLGQRDLTVPDAAAVTVVMAAPGYPAENDAGTPIDGLEEAGATGALVFHAGTAVRGDTVVTNGGRIVGLTGVGRDLADARRRAYAGVERVSFAGARWRSDIALAATQGMGIGG
jgi:phosphoribosylamine---glycine ligase